MTVQRITRRAGLALSSRLKARRAASRQREEKYLLADGEISGVVEGFVLGELRGWITEQQGHPPKPSVIRCVGNTGHSSDFRATYRRDDLCKAFHRDDVRGFSLPADLLHPLGEAINVQDKDGIVLRNGGTILTSAENGQSTAGTNVDHWIFLHIPKTGGTSLRNAICRNISPGRVLLVYPGDKIGVSMEDVLAMPISQRSGFRFICGHTRFGLHQRIDAQAQYVTFIREPAARLRSNAAHHMLSGRCFELDGSKVLAAQALNEGLSDEFDNLMTRLIAGVSIADVGLGEVGEEHVEKAIDNIRAHFRFIGHQARMVDDSLTLQRIMGLPASGVGFDNVTRERRQDRVEQLGWVDWPRVMRRNRFDSLLHDKIESLRLSSRDLRT